MKNNAIAIILVLAMLSGCKKIDPEMNVNPNSPTNVPLRTVLNSAVVSSVRTLHGATMNLTYTSTWAQQVGKIQYIDEDRYAFRNAHMDLLWENLYSEPLSDLQVVIDKAVEAGEPNMEGVARTMKVYIFHQLTDVWGDVPYFAALQGAKSDGTLQPKFDPQSEIYMDMINELKKANDLLNVGGDDIGKDPVYNGDISLWKKFSNSLRTRLLMRISKIDPGTAQAGIEEILGDPVKYPVFESNADDAQVSWLTNVPYRNPWFENAQTRDDHGISNVMVNILNDRNDPRLQYLAEPNDSGEYVGQQPGDSTQPQLALVSRIGKAFRDDASAPSFLMTFAELKFIITEAANNGWNAGTSVEQAYNDAINASFDKFGVNIGNYLLEPKVNINIAVSSGEKAQLIAEQKWIALFSQGNETFAEYRRTGFPLEIKEVPASAYPGMGIPLRFPYPTGEATTNRENLAAAQSGIVKEMFGKRMWWDVN